MASFKIYMTELSNDHNIYNALISKFPQHTSLSFNLVTFDPVQTV